MFSGHASTEGWLELFHLIGLMSNIAMYEHELYTQLYPFNTNYKLVDYYILGKFSCAVPHTTYSLSIAAIHWPSISEYDLIKIDT